ncbi:ATP-binding cassette domain-containing protein [Photorhabdus heterorhabditis]|nr:ATP-binding cassette domain-containing protein [Photorhabdus heterorhabditis]KOY62070.1 hypothetical protein AM629_10610 [Photorhabdus heterorhabditis]
MIEIININKSFSNNKIISNASYKFPSNGLVRIDGINGSGKSTLLSILAGIIKPDSGKIIYKEKKLYVPEKCPIYGFIKGYEYINLIESLQPCSPQTKNDLINGFKLREFMNVRFSDMSLGTAKKFMLVTALMYLDILLVLDEPTNGLDQDSIKYLISILMKIKDRNLIIFASHDLKFNNIIDPNTISITYFKR